MIDAASLSIPEIDELDLDPHGVDDPSRCDRCGEVIGGEPAAEVHFKGVAAVVHAEPCAEEMVAVGWDTA